MASQAQEVTLLFKKNFGVADTQDANAVSQESIPSRTRIIPSVQIFGQPIPTTTPSDFIKDNSYSSVFGQRYTSASYPYITYYSSITMSSINLYESYWYSQASLANPAVNILANAIPNTYGIGGYTVNVYDSTRTPILAGGTYPWTFDVDGGILKFYNNLTSANAPPTITFYRYEGTFGIPSSFFNLSTATVNLSTLQFVERDQVDS